MSALFVAVVAVGKKFGCFLGDKDLRKFGLLRSRGQYPKNQDRHDLDIALDASDFLLIEFSTLS